MSSKTHNKHIKLDTNLTKRSSDPDNDREISNEKIDIYELCIHPIRHSLTLYPYMYDLSRHHSHYNTNVLKRSSDRDNDRESSSEKISIWSSVYDTPNTLLTNFISMYKWPSWTCVTFPSQPYLHERFEKTIIWSKVRSRELERKDPNLWVRHSNQHTTHHSLTYYPVLLLWGMGSTCIYPLLHFALF